MTRRSMLILRLTWIATVAALAALWRIEALVLLVPLAMLGPVIDEVRPGPDLDERERSLDRHGSHLALIGVYLLIFLLFCRKVFILEQEPDELFLLLAVPLIIRAIVAIGRGRGVRRLGLVLGFVFGGIWLSFTLVSHGFTLEAAAESAVGASILLATLLALRWPRFGGAMLFLVGLLFMVFVHAPLARGQYLQALTMAVILALPPLIAGIALFASGARSAEDEFKEFRAKRPAE